MNATSRPDAGPAASAEPARGAYVADTSPERFTPPSDPWVARVLTVLDDGVRLVAPHGATWTTSLGNLREATDVERGWYDALTGRPATGAGS